ncbi:MAG: hypothetical protein N2504_06400 [candidate division WOR-3 bacterium]|nr:hypothetical protein [candidate division WOR-3 bacterium]MCX7948199.1 hypothetical protein [candidate division WOR-3 bacterium]MDW8151104.1 hypothetical protein [candidate division WOR-3 bacterium]
MKVALIGHTNSEDFYKFLLNAKFERTFAFSIDRKLKFNELSRRLGFNVIVVNPNYLDWKEEFKSAILDFSPDIILNIEFLYSLEDFDVYNFYNFEKFFVVEYKENIIFLGDSFSEFLNILKEKKKSL